MRRLSLALLVVLASASLAIAGCSQPAPAPTPTKAAAAPAATAPAKASEPTKAAAPATSQPTAAPAAKSNWPEKGKAITILVPWAAGSPNDVFSRMLAPYMEKELGIPVNVEAKPGAGSQIGMTELAKAKPDGYTIGVNSLETTIATYLDPERKAVFDRKAFIPISMMLLEPDSLIGKGGSAYKTAKDLIDAAKAKPESIKVGTNGVMTATHMGVLVIEKAAGVKFASVHFNGSNENSAALLGGHTDAGVVIASGNVSQIKSGDLTLLGPLGDKGYKYPAFPEAKNLADVGYDTAVFWRSLGMDAPAGTPADIVAKYDEVLKKTLENAEFQKKTTDANIITKYMDSKTYGAHWDKSEATMKVLMAELKTETKK